jgi:LysM repeat protein
MSVKALNPFNAPGSPQAEQRRIRRERFKFVVWTVVVANVLLLMGLLIQGCQREPAEGGASGGNGAEMASSDTNGMAMGQPTPDTNALVTPTFEAPTTNTFAESAATNAAPNPVQGGAKQYRVVKGDSFYKIARANGVSMKALRDANPGMDSAKLKVGQELQLPAGAQASTAAPAKAPAHASATVGTSRSTYVVKSGDTLGRIAKAHRTTVKAIKAANGLTSDRLAVGRTLKIPQPKAGRAGTAQV